MRNKMRIEFIILMTIVGFLILLLGFSAGLSYQQHIAVKKHHAHYDKFTGKFKWNEIKLNKEK